MKLGYIMFSSVPECKEDDINKLEAFGCDKIFIEQLENEEKRPQWKKMLKEVGRNDEIVILRLSNALRGLVPLASFFELCRVKKIRIISLKDKFDSWDEIFPPSTSLLIDIIGSFPGDIRSSKIAGSRISAARRRKKSSFQTNKEEREKRCVDLYKNGTSIRDIKEETGFSSSSSIYRILENNGIKVDRRVAKNTVDK